MSHDCDTVVVGAGVVGLAIARALALSGHDVLVLEKHGRVGSEVSSRSSEVIHGGLYYPPGSLKARLCMAGRKAAYRFAEENGVAVRRRGKLLVAHDESELAALDAIAAIARANGVENLERLSADAARAREPELHCAAALLSPESGVVDSHALMQALEGHVTGRGAAIQLATEVVGLAADAAGFAVLAQGGEQTTRISCRRLVLAAGLGATSLGRMLTYRDGYAVPETYFAKGHYFTSSTRPPFSHLVYPLPSDGGLGIHFTIDAQSAARFGPDIAWTDAIDYAFDDAGGVRSAAFERAIRRYWPGLPDGALQPAFVGVRPKISRAGAAAADFAIHSAREHAIPGLVALYGIDSPGLTSCLAIGDHVAELLR